MKIKKILAGILACVTVSGALPYSNYAIPENSAITASAETYESLEYYKYSDHIEIIDCDESATEVVIPSEIEGLPVTSIGEYAFLECLSLTSITIPDSVTSIGGWAFSDCTGLTSIIIPDSVTEIGEMAFDDCSGLTSITIPDSVASIGNYAFHGCSGLTSITVGENNSNYTDVDGILFNKDLSEIISYPPAKKETSYAIPDGVASIGISAFSFCSNLTSITIPESITSIGHCAFNDCSGLTSITIPDSVTSIGNSAFMNCSGLTSITIPDSVTSIGDSAFMNCSGLTSITIPDSVTKIEAFAFSTGTDLTSITIKNPECKIYEYSLAFTTATIYGYSNSTAQAYAENWNRKFVSLGDAPTEPTTGTSTITGDATGDGKLDVSDVIAISAYVANPENNPLPEQALLSCDVHNTGNGLDANDVLMIQQYLAKIITEL